MTDMTKAQAHEKIAALRADPEWVKRYTQGSPAEQREMSDLMKVAHAPTAAPESTPKTEAQERIKALRADPAWVARYTNSGANEQREFSDLMKVAHADATAEKT